ncbi:hypothetical protein PVAP13_3NG091460 [Panicum virgatum]|uniref:Uncharacterized protein n=1 Tax=Panicum virgatum TaxID=38727 RepID=A0A8T0UH75_PANVG|nr:hypothetical protein PVAP13_3NG091460 [Panicum virgatum]
MGARAISIMASSQRRDSGEGGLIIRLLLPASLARPVGVNTGDHQSKLCGRTPGTWPRAVPLSPPQRRTAGLLRVPRTAGRPATGRTRSSAADPVDLARRRPGLRHRRAVLDGAARRPRPRAPPASRARWRRHLLRRGPLRRRRRPPLAYATVERGERGEGENELGFAGAGGRPAVLIRSGTLQAVGWHPTARGGRLAPRAKQAGRGGHFPGPGPGFWAWSPGEEAVRPNGPGRNSDGPKNE